MVKEKKAMPLDSKSICTPSPLIRSSFIGESPKVMRIEQQINEKNEEINQILNMMRTQNYDLSRYQKDLEKMKLNPGISPSQICKADQTALEQFSNILSEKLRASQTECDIVNKSICLVLKIYIKKLVLIFVWVENFLNCFLS